MQSIMHPPADVARFFENITLPQPDSHKGQNGKLLIIGGSELFHAASKWSLDVASKFVDMVFYASIPSNNELIHEAKGEFWNGIVVPRDEVESYIEEADAALIGPGMTRTEDTKKIVDNLLQKYPQKKWVLDAGALQMVDPKLLNENCIITPHSRELDQVLSNFGKSREELMVAGPTILLKGRIDEVWQGEKSIEIAGGNAGMTKGGTGDVLAGLVAALYTKHDALPSAVVASYANKAAGDHLYQTVGPYFNASDLVETVPKVFWELLQNRGI